MARPYDVNHLEDQKNSVFNVDLNNQDAMMDFMETFNDFNKDISNRDVIFDVVGRYYENPVAGANGKVYYSPNKGHFVIDVSQVGGKRKKHRSRSIRRTNKKKTTTKRRRSVSKRSRARKTKSHRKHRR